MRSAVISFAAACALFTAGYFAAPSLIVLTYSVTGIKVAIFSLSSYTAFRLITGFSLLSSLLSAHLLRYAKEGNGPFSCSLFFLFLGCSVSAFCAGDLLRLVWLKWTAQAAALDLAELGYSSWGMAGIALFAAAAYILISAKKGKE